MIDVDAVEVLLRVTSARTGEVRTFLLRRVHAPRDDWTRAVHDELRVVHPDDVGTVLDGYEVS